MPHRLGNSPNEDGVEGTSVSANGVQGVSERRDGVYGRSEGRLAAGVYGVHGPIPTTADRGITRSIRMLTECTVNCGTVNTVRASREKLCRPMVSLGKQRRRRRAVFTASIRPTEETKGVVARAEVVFSESREYLSQAVLLALMRMAE